MLFLEGGQGPNPWRENWGKLANVRKQEEGMRPFEAKGQIIKSLEYCFKINDTHQAHSIVPGVRLTPQIGAIIEHHCCSRHRIDDKMQSPLSKGPS